MLETPTLASATVATTATGTHLEVDIEGLRKQIFANAATLFPQVMADSKTFQTHSLVAPTHMFDIIVTASNNQMRAILVYGNFPHKRMIIKGGTAATSEEALRNLLDTTSEALGWYTETLLGELQNPEPCLKGEIDYGMVEGGFNYAAEQRLAQEKPTS